MTDSTALRSRVPVLLLACAVLLTAGCGETTVTRPGEPTVDTPDSAAPSPVDESAAPADAPLTPETVKLTEATWTEMEQIIASHAGKIVVVDLWATSCQPCIREFHNLVEISEANPAEIVCLSFSLDYAGIKSKPPAFYEERVRNFLSEQGAKFDNYLCNEDPETVYAALNLASIPAVMVFGKDGKLVERFDNDQGKYGDEFTYEAHVLPLVERLLTGDAPAADE